MSSLWTRIKQRFWATVSPPPPPNSLPGVAVLADGDVYRANIQQIDVIANKARGRTLQFGSVTISLRHAGADYIAVYTFKPSSTTSWRPTLVECHNYKGLLSLDARWVRKYGFVDDLSNPKHATYTQCPLNHAVNLPKKPTPPILDPTSIARVRVIKNKDRTRTCTVVNQWEDLGKGKTSIKLEKGGLDVIVVYEFTIRPDTCSWRPDAVELYTTHEANMLVDALTTRGFTKKKAILGPTTELVLTRAS